LDEKEKQLMLIELLNILPGFNENRIMSSELENRDFVKNIIDF